MDNTFEDELRGSDSEAIAAQQQIGKYFRRYGESGYKDATKHQLMFAGKIMHTIAKSELKHPKIYCQIITGIFGDALRPESGPNFWSTYVNNLRYFHFNLVTKKEYESASQIYHYIASHNNKLQTEEVSMTIINIYCHHLFLQSSNLQVNRNGALRELHHIVENLTYLFQEMLEKNKELNLQYKDVLQKTLQWLLPSTGLAKINQLFSTLADGGKVAAMFMALFKLYTQQRISLPSKEEIHQQAQFIIETMDTFIVFDVMDKFQMQLSVQLIRHCRLDNRVRSEKALADIFCQLYEYLKLICAQQPTAGFDSLITKHSEGFRTLFDMHSKSLMNHAWFKDFLVFLNTVHTQMQNTAVFACFWRQMTSLSSYQALLTLLLETMKLAPCISTETKLNSITCCSSFRKHVILLVANNALSTFVLYCQNVKNEPEGEEVQGQSDEMEKPVDIYTETLLKPLLLIVGHAFKVIDKMECIVSTSQDIKMLLTRFKQAALSACTARQANTCIKLCELFLKIKNKIPEDEWPLMLRRVYKVAAQCLSNKNPNRVRDLQMCYIASLLQLRSEIDFSQIRAQISIYYCDDLQDQQNQRQVSSDQPTTASHDKCLMHMLQQSTNPLRPHLKPERKKLLHWLETQHVVKYYRSNVALMQSLIQSSQSYYDFVITTRSAKLTTNDVPKFVSIYKYFRSKTSELSGVGRLDHLTYGHTCTKILQEYQNVRSQKASFDSKDFAEDQLEQLLLRKEMETMTICTELVNVKLAYDGFKAFETFYDKFDEEQISSDDALIDWEAIIDDLIVLAQFLQFASYMEYSSHVWLLHYRISQLLLDNFSASRGLAFFCEHSEFYEQNGQGSVSRLKLDKEILLHLPIITCTLENLSTLPRRKQNHVLLATLQIAQYYARCSKYTYAQMLLQFVEEKHKELPDRQGHYDIVMATLDIIRYRLLWKHAKAMDGQKKRRSAAEDLLLNQCLMGEIEQTLDRLKEFVFSSGDGLAYNMLITSLAQDMAECTANRLYENFLNSLFVVACKCALQNGFALRMVQIMCTWMLVNLQMEYVHMAQTKLKIMEYIMGIKSLKELSAGAAKAVADIKSSQQLPDTASTGMEAMRRMAQVQLSPIKTGKLQLRPESQKTELKNYFKFKIDTKTLPPNELLEWTYFTIGCLNARLYFLVEDYVQLEIFYERGSQWLDGRQNGFNQTYFKNIQLMAIQHYANYLRACRQQDKAIQCLMYGLELCDAMKSDVDVVYRVNFRLQLTSARKELDTSGGKLTKLSNSKIRRGFTFNLSPEELKYNNENITRPANRVQMLQQAMSSVKKSAVVNVVCTSSSRTVSARKTKFQGNSSGNSSPEAKSRIKAKLKFNICEDTIEIIDSDDNSHPIESKPAAKKDLKDNKRATKAVTSPKRTKKATKSIKTSNNSMDLIKSPKPTAAPIASTSSLSSSMECLQTKENLPDNDQVTEKEVLEFVDKLKQMKPKGRPRKVPIVKTPTATVIILEDSPSTKRDKAEPTPRSCLKSNKVPDVVSGTGTESEPIAARPIRRRRNLITDNNENLEINIRSSNHPSSSNNTTSAIITSSSVANRRRQKI